MLKFGLKNIKYTDISNIPAGIANNPNFKYDNHNGRSRNENKNIHLHSSLSKNLTSGNNPFKILDKTVDKSKASKKMNYTIANIGKTTNTNKEDNNSKPQQKLLLVREKSQGKRRIYQTSNLETNLTPTKSNTADKNNIYRTCSNNDSEINNSNNNNINIKKPLSQAQIISNDKRKYRNKSSITFNNYYKKGNEVLNKESKVNNSSVNYNAVFLDPNNSTVSHHFTKKQVVDNKLKSNIDYSMIPQHDSKYIRQKKLIDYNPSEDYQRYNTRGLGLCDKVNFSLNKDVFGKIISNSAVKKLLNYNYDKKSSPIKAIKECKSNISSKDYNILSNAKSNKNDIDINNYIATSIVNSNGHFAKRLNFPSINNNNNNNIIPLINNDLNKDNSILNNSKKRTDFNSLDYKSDSISTEIKEKYLKLNKNYSFNNIIANPPENKRSLTTGKKKVVYDKKEYLIANLMKNNSAIKLKYEKSTDNKFDNNIENVLCDGNGFSISNNSNINIEEKKDFNNKARNTHTFNHFKLNLNNIHKSTNTNNNNAMSHNNINNANSNVNIISLNKSNSFPIKINHAPVNPNINGINNNHNKDGIITSNDTNINNTHSKLKNNSSNNKHILKIKMEESSINELLRFNYESPRKCKPLTNKINETAYNNNADKEEVNLVSKMLLKNKLNDIKISRKKMVSNSSCKLNDNNNIKLIVEGQYHEYSLKN